MVVERLQNSFKKYALNNAFCIEDKYYSYADTSAIVCSIKKQIDQISDKEKTQSVAVVCTNDIRTYSSLLAIWFSGFSYVPLGLHNPTDRNISILKEANVNIIISTIDLEEEEYSLYTVIKPDSTISSTQQLNATKINEESLAYILFTSGSTGVPKGVPITHKNLSAFIENFFSTGFDIQQSDRCLQMFELTFDVSISSFLLPLIKGACVYTPNEGIKYVQILKVIQKYQLTSIQIVPSIIRLGKNLISRMKLPDVKNCILTGEATTVDLFSIWKECIHNANVYNFYGPTESAIYCSFYKCNEKIKSYNGMLAIGKPMKNIKLIIVNENYKESSVNEKGELLIGGNQLTTGYLNDFVKSENSFVILESSKEVFYKSGDMCFKDDEGDIYYCGRYDNQIKIQGFRIELNEIEFTVRDKFDMNNIVVSSENKLGITELVLVLENENNSNEIIDYLKSKLPGYMIPAKVLTMKEFPINSSGKTDRNKIKTLIGEDR